MRSSSLDAAILLLTGLGGSAQAALPRRSNDGVVQVDIPASAAGASIPHSASFQSFSFEPAFWVESVPFFSGRITLGSVADD